MASTTSCHADEKELNVQRKESNRNEFLPEGKGKVIPDLEQEKVFSPKLEDLTSSPEISIAFEKHPSNDESLPLLGEKLFTLSSGKGVKGKESCGDQGGDKGFDSFSLFVEV